MTRSKIKQKFNILHLGYYDLNFILHFFLRGYLQYIQSDYIRNDLES